MVLCFSCRVCFQVSTCSFFFQPRLTPKGNACRLVVVVVVVVQVSVVPFFPPGFYTVFN